MTEPSPPPTAEQLAEWHRLEQAATKGPWRKDSHSGWLEHSGAPVKGLSCSLGVIHFDEDADFVAAARTAVPALLSEVERLRALNERWERATGATLEQAEGNAAAEREQLAFIRSSL